MQIIILLDLRVLLRLGLIVTPLPCLFLPQPRRCQSGLANEVAGELILVVFQVRYTVIDKFGVYKGGYQFTSGK